jgi:hypothetical protein
MHGPYWHRVLLLKEILGRRLLLGMSVLQILSTFLFWALIQLPLPGPGDCFAPNCHKVQYYWAPDADSVVTVTVTLPP